MKIRISGDIHKTRKVSHPGKFHAFSNIFKQFLDQGIEQLILIAKILGLPNPWNNI
jgi:hypothetical protein